MEERKRLKQLSQSCTETSQRVEHAKIALMADEGQTITAIAEKTASRRLHCFNEAGLGDPPRYYDRLPAPRAPVRDPGFSRSD